MGKAQQTPAQEASTAPDAGAADVGAAMADNSVQIDRLAGASVEDDGSSLLGGAGDVVPLDTAPTVNAGTTTVNAVSNVTFSFTADTLQDAVAQMRAHDKNEFGHVAWSPNWDWEDDGKGHLIKANVTLDLQKEMPDWTNVGDATAAEQKEWKRFYAALDTHEDGHVKLATDTFTGLGETLGAMSPTAANKKWATTVANHTAAQKKYDADTKHGETQGTNITIPAADTKSAETSDASPVGAGTDDPIV